MIIAPYPPYGGKWLFGVWQSSHSMWLGPVSPCSTTVCALVQFDPLPLAHAVVNRLYVVISLGCRGVSRGCQAGNLLAELRMGEPR